MRRKLETTIGDEQMVKQVIRYISKQNRSMQVSGEWSVEDVDNYLSEWLNKGFRLFSTHYLGENPEGYGMMYVLVKDA